MVAEAILNSSIFKNLVEVAPGLKEFYFLARLQQLAERKAAAAGAGGPDYELLIWDAPASGHFLTTLPLGAAAFEAFLSKGRWLPPERKWTDSFQTRRICRFWR